MEAKTYLIIFDLVKAGCMYNCVSLSVWGGDTKLTMIIILLKGELLYNVPNDYYHNSSFITLL